MLSTAEVLRCHSIACGPLVGDAQNRLRVVLMTAILQQVLTGRAEVVSVKEVRLSQPVIFADCSENVFPPNLTPCNHRPTIMTRLSHRRARTADPFLERAASL
jgi:hypothetical protein